jgi:hypothetical protein
LNDEKSLTGSLYGYSVAIDRPYIVVGAPTDKNTNDSKKPGEGAIYVIKTSSNTAYPLSYNKYTANDGQVGNDFGRSLAISNNVIVVGSPSDEINQKQKHGSAYAFELKESINGFSLSRIQKIYHGDGNEYDQFGFSLSKYKNRIAIGIPLKEVFSSLSGNVTFNQGAVHIYEQDQKTDNWDLSQVVTANDGGTGDKFGTSTAIYDYVLIASTDSEDPAYVFHRYDEIYCYGKRAIDEGACGGSSNGTCVA